MTPPVFKTGDVTTLKAGGPKMVVELGNDTGAKQVSCIWITEPEGILRRENIKPECLTEPKRPRTSERTEEVYPPPAAKAR